MADIQVMVSLKRLILMKTAANCFFFLLQIAENYETLVLAAAILHFAAVNCFKLLLAATN